MRTQLGDDEVMQDIGGNGLQRGRPGLARVLVGSVEEDHDHRRCDRQECPDFLRWQAADGRVDNQDIGGLSSRETDGLEAVARLADNCPAPGALYDFAQRPAHGRHGVGDDNSDLNLDIHSNNTTEKTVGRHRAEVSKRMDQGLSPKWALVGDK